MTTLRMVFGAMLLVGAGCDDAADPDGGDDADVDADQRDADDDEALDADEDAALEPEEGFWDVGGTRLHYRIVGDVDQRPPIVLLHGGPGGNLLGWLPIEELADAYTLIEYDQRGSGESDRLPLSYQNQDASLMSVERHVADLDEIRQQLGLERLVIVGHSWGATLATFYAAAHPDRVERVVLYSGGSTWAEISEQQAAAQAARMTAEQLDEQQRLNDLLVANIAAWSQDELDQWFLDMASLTMPTLQCDPEADLGGESGRAGFWANYLTNRYEDSFDRDAFRPQLEAIAAPALVIYGRCEPAPIERQLYLRDALQDATMVVFEESGHQALLEQHELFMDLVRAFLADEPLPMPAYTGSGE